MFQLIFYVPATHLEKVKDALFNAGAGKYKNYDIPEITKYYNLLLNIN